MTYCDECCDGWCIDHYDACCDKCCPGISHDMRDFFVNCCVWLVVGSFIISIVFLIGGFAFVRHASITAEDASLTRFALVTTSLTTALTYNLSLTLSVRNPNWVKSWKYTEPLVAFYSFNGYTIDHIKLEDAGKKLGARKTQVYNLSTAADNEYVLLGGDGITQFKRQNGTGEFEVEVVIISEILCKLHYTRCNLKATCTLKLQLTPHKEPAAMSQKVRCKLAKPEKNC